MKKTNVLVIGSGGREHAIGWKLRKSHHVGKLYFAPGNGGTRLIGENIPIAVEDISRLVTFAKTHEIGLTVVGPELPLSLGIIEAFTKKNLLIFGASQKASRLETSKAWAVTFMQKHKIPHPKTHICTSYKEAMRAVGRLNGNCVLKADGLASGKGVFVCTSEKEAEAGLRELFIHKSFGKAGLTVLVQERLIGKEVSIMAFCDGTKAVPLVAAQDYKRVYDGDRGPNTGSMGSCVPPNHGNVKIFRKVHELLHHTVSCMKQHGMPYIGVLYAGIMIVGDSPYVLEFNCRFGDPETQAQLPLLKTDLFQILRACCTGKLTERMVVWKKQASVCVVLAAHGYPGSYAKGNVISGLPETGDTDGVIIFHAGTQFDQHVTKTSGGRVLGIVATALTIAKARAHVYNQIGQNIYFHGMHYRTDIGI